MNLFIIKNNSPTPSPEALLIPEFKALWERGKKAHATEDLAYVHFMVDYQSPYRAYPPDDRANEICKDHISRNGWVEDVQIKAAMDKYDRLQQTPTLRLLRAIEHTLEEITIYFETIDFKSNKMDIKKIIESAEKVEKLTITIKSLQDKVKSEQNIGSTVRGGGLIGDYER